LSLDTYIIDKRWRVLVMYYTKLPTDVQVKVLNTKIIVAGGSFELSPKEPPNREML
jgi:hypothetical protein